MVVAPVSAHEGGHEDEDDPIIISYCPTTPYLSLTPNELAMLEPGSAEYEMALELLGIDEPEGTSAEEIFSDFFEAGSSWGVSHHDCRWEMDCVCLRWIYLPAPSNPVCAEVYCGPVFRCG